MGKSRIRESNRQLSIAMQDMFVRQRFPQFRFSWQSGTGLWRGTLQPREISPVYSVLMKYKVGAIPRIWVTSPPLRSDAPHRYKDGSLCLFWHKEWNWDPDQDLSVTVMPWAAIWIYYYELWLDVGEWLVESVSHSPPSQGD